MKKIPFDIGKVPLSYIEEGTIPLRTPQEGPLILLTDGNANEQMLERHRNCFGRDNIELHHFTKHPKLVSAYLFVIDRVRSLLSEPRPTLKSDEYVEICLMILEKVYNEFCEKFPELVTEDPSQLN